MQEQDTFPYLVNRQARLLYHRIVHGRLPHILCLTPSEEEGKARLRIEVNKQDTWLAFLAIFTLTKVTFAITAKTSCQTLYGCCLTNSSLVIYEGEDFF